MPIPHSDARAQTASTRPQPHADADAAVKPPRNLAAVPMRVLDRPPPRVELHQHADGSCYVGCGYALETPDELLIDYFERALATRPQVTFLGERGSDRQWRRLRYEAAARDTAAIATWLIRWG